MATKTQTVIFKVTTSAKWVLGVNGKDVPTGSPKLELEPSDEPYLLYFYFQGEPATSYEVTVSGAILLQPIKNAIPVGFTRDGGIVDLKV